MKLSLIQACDTSRNRLVIARDERGNARIVPGVDRVYTLARSALTEGIGLEEAVERLGEGDPVDLSAWSAAGQLLPPVDHPDAAHLMVSGTGLTHLGSAEGRDQMHRSVAAGEPMTDSMKMFRLGLEGGKPGPGKTGVQPEWFYKGNGHVVVAPGADLPMPEFGLDGGDEAEIVGIYLIDDHGAPRRLGFALGNEFSDHVMERQNYLNLAHSKLRPCSFGPELRLGELPADVRGRVGIRRGAEVIWERPFHSGESNMCHSIANLEAHHFKYAAHRVPGDVHVHFFGTATLSFSDGIQTQPGDVFEVQADEFGLALRNRLARMAAPTQQVRML